MAVELPPMILLHLDDEGLNDEQQKRRDFVMENLRLVAQGKGNPVVQNQIRELNSQIEQILKEQVRRESMELTRRSTARSRYALIVVTLLRF